MLHAPFAVSSSAPIDVLGGLQSVRGTTPRRPLPRVPAAAMDHAAPAACAQDLASLWREVQAMSAHEVDSSLDVVLDRLRSLMLADGLRWRLLSNGRPGKSLCVAERQAGDWPEDAARPTLARHGWEQAGHDLELSWPLRPGLRMQFTLVREASVPDFQEADRATLELALAGIGRWLHWLALSHGPANSPDPLPAHQRKVLLLLLTGLSEKQIASELNISTNTAHQYVTALYRRFKVRNRPSLTAQWMA